MISGRERLLNYAVLTVFAVVAMVPLLGVVTSALTPAAQSSPSFTWPESLDWGNFATAWNEGHFAAYLRSSVLVAVVVVLLTGVLAILAGFSFAHFTYPGRQLLFYVTLVGLMVPPEAFVIGALLRGYPRLQPGEETKMLRSRAGRAGSPPGRTGVCRQPADTQRSHGI